jgi:hypothetical protein
VAPRFLADDSDEVVTAICREARTTFGADYGVLWRVRDGALELLAIEPPHPELAGWRLQLDQFPRLREALNSFGASFVPDVLETTHGDGLAFVRKLASARPCARPSSSRARPSSSCPSPGNSDLGPSPRRSWSSALRRPGGLALEQLQRRRAEAEIAARVDATRSSRRSRPRCRSRRRRST